MSKDEARRIVDLIAKDPAAMPRVVSLPVAFKALAITTLDRWATSAKRARR